MKDILLFGGTAEGRELAQWLAEGGWKVALCVATDYGAALVPDHPNIVLSARRLTQEEMEELMASRPFACVVDATHPYAVAVTDNIQAAAAVAGLPYHRLLRQSDGEEGCLKADSMAQAADLLEELPGHILLTTGSKELDAFARPGLVERCYPRVLPTLDSLGRCLDLGFLPQNILCMQGPFTRAMNQATMEQYDIQVLVTKDTGGYGGFREKAEAAKAAGCTLLVVERPRRETGLTLKGLKERLEREANG